VYYNLINLGASSIASGNTEFRTLTLALHGGVFVSTALLLAARHWSLGLRSRVRALRLDSHAETPA